METINREYGKYERGIYEGKNGQFREAVCRGLQLRKHNKVFWGAENIIWYYCCYYIEIEERESEDSHESKEKSYFFKKTNGTAEFPPTLSIYTIPYTIDTHQHIYKLRKRLRWMCTREEKYGTKTRI